MNVLITILFTLFLSLSAFAGQVQASGSNVSCTTISTGTYTSRESCAKIIVDKKVLKPGTKDYVDGLSAIDPKYQIGNEVTFQIVVTNTGAEKLSTIVVTDTLPQFITFVSGPGSYDSAANKLTFVIASLESGQSQTVYVKTKVTDNVTFPNNGITCVTNFVQASENTKGVNADDSTAFCIERPLKVFPPAPVKQTPPTGPEAVALPILMGMGGAGMFLRRKVK